MQYSRLSKQYGVEIYLKKEQLHYTGSVKERGVFYLLTCLTQVISERERERERIRPSCSLPVGQVTVCLCRHTGALSITDPCSSK